MFKAVKRTKETKEVKECMTLQEAISFLEGFCGTSEKKDVEVDCKMNWGMIIQLGNGIKSTYFQ